jgi:hypothetical protein
LEPPAKPVIESDRIIETDLYLPLNQIRVFPTFTCKVDK